MKQVLFYIPFLILSYACTKDVGRVSYGGYPPEIGRIISTQCALPGCHTSQSSAGAGSFNLESWQSMFAGANSGQPVIPYSSRFSSLCYYINTYPELGPQNKPTMPLNRAPLSAAEVKTVMDWIDAGAPDAQGNVKWADDPLRKKLYAANQGCDVVTVFDSETQMPMRYIEVGNKKGGDTPHQLRVSPDGKYWYVIFINNNVMQKFRCSDDSYVGDIPLTPYAAGTSSDPASDAADWNTFAIAPDGKTAYCVSWQQNGKIALVDLENRRLLAYIGGQHWPHGIALSKNGDKVYVATQTGNFITEWDRDLQSGRRIALETVLKEYSSIDPHELLLSPDGNSLWITCSGSAQVMVLDLVTEKVTAVVSTGDYPREIAYAETGNCYYVSCPGRTPTASTPGVITRIDAVTKAAQNISCGFQPHGLAADENSKLLYVLSRNVGSGGPLPHHTPVCNGKNGFVNFIDLKTGKVTPDKFELSVDPYFISARP